MGALQDLRRRLVETVEERSGREVVPRGLLESTMSDLRVANKTLDFIGFSLLNYQPGDPGSPGGFELRPQVRRFAAQQALRAWIEDPLAGQQVDLYVSFVFGRGVPRPQAHDQEVQKHLDNTWDDDANKRILTSFDRLVEKGVDLCLQSNVYFTFFDDGQDGMVRVSLLRFDDVEDVVRHDELAEPDKGDRFRILYYKALERRVKYDFRSGGRTAPATERNADGTAKTVYYEAWGAFDEDDPVRATQDEGLRQPPEGMVRPGKVYHLAVNKTSEMAFGVPRMRRLIRWFTAYNETMESHVNRMKAMASVYMKATAKGSQRDLDRLAQMATNRTSAFGGARDVDEDRPPAPRGPGILGQNESLNYEPFKIDSGATDLQASAPILRGQVNGPWPDHYTAGTAGTLAGSTAMELPVLKFVEREQELWLGLFRAFCDASIKAAVKAGDITEFREPTESELMQVQAAEQAGEPAPYELNAKGEIKRDLGYDISLPNPLKRAMGDLVSAAIDIATAVDPNGENQELSRWLFGFILAEAFDAEDPQRIVDQVLPRQFKPPEPEPQIDPATGLPVEGAVGADGQRHPPDNPYGAPRTSPPPEDQRVQETVRSAMDAAREWSMELYGPVLNRPMDEFELDAGSNGNGSHG